MDLGDDDEGIPNPSNKDFVARILRGNTGQVANNNYTINEPGLDSCRRPTALTLRPPSDPLHTGKRHSRRGLPTVKWPADPPLQTHHYRASSHRSKLVCSAVIPQDCRTFRPQLVRMNHSPRAGAHSFLVLLSFWHPEGSCIYDGQQSKWKTESSIVCLLKDAFDRSLGEREGTNRKNACPTLVLLDRALAIEVGSTKM